MGAPLFGIGAGGQKVHQTIDYDLTGDLPSELTFTRASIATYIGSDGLLKTASSGERRVEYDPITRENLGTFMEPGSTNLCTHSEDFNNAAWGKTGAVASNVTAISPKGFAGATTLIDNESGGPGNVILKDNIVLPTANTYYVFSVYAKADQLDWIGVGTQTFASGTSYFDLTNGVTGTKSGAHAASGIEPMGNGWYRCWIKFDPVATLSGGLRILVDAGNEDAIVDLDGTSSVLIYGAECEESECMTSYIATAGTTQTRAADVLEETGVTWFNAGGDGTVIVDCSLPEGVTDGWIASSVIGCDLLNITDNTWNEGVRLISRPTISTEEMRCKLTTRLRGRHTGADNQTTILTDSSLSLVVDLLIGKIISNLTDGSTGTITSNTATTITCTGLLSGGTDNDWDSGDNYEVNTSFTTNNTSLFTFAWVANETVSVFAKWTNVESRLFLDGAGQSAAASDPNVPATLNKLSIGHTHADTFQWRGHIKRVRYFDTAQADPS